MSNTDGPRGLFVVGHLNGGNGQVRNFNVDGGTATAIYPGDPAKEATDGSAEVMTAQSDAYIGPITAIYNSDGKPVKSLAASAAGSVDVDIDPGAIIEIQTEDGGTALTAAAIGDAADFIWTHAGAGSRSGVELSETLAGAGAAAQMRIIGLANVVDNVWGEHYARVHVIALEHAFNSTPNAI